MSAYVLEFVGMAGTYSVGPQPPEGSFLSSYDPEAHEGRGFAEWTVNISEALHFPDATAALEEWRRVPASRPMRADGRPNRPLTACTVVVREAP